jgi:NADH-quinone oxidoreductase subunit C
MTLRDRVEKCLLGDIVEITECQGDLFVEVERNRIVACLEKLKETEGLEFDFLSDVVGVDNSALYEKAKKAKKKKKKDEEEEPEEPVKEEPTPPRFEVIYLLLSLKSNERLAVKIRVPEEDPVVDTVTTIWRAADWPEREVYDMFGIRFRGHHNLKRLLMWDGFGSYPLRKDYPLEGKGEERHFDYCD